MATSIEQVILASAINHESAAHALLPHIKPAFFETQEAKQIWLLVDAYLREYACLPPKEALQIEAAKLSVPEETFSAMEAVIDKVYTPQAASVWEKNEAWVLKEAESWCLNRSVYLAILKSISVMDGKPVDGKVMEKTAIPAIMQEALNVSFDRSIGHDFFGDAAARHEFYHQKLARIPSGLSALDHVLKGGFPTKSINILLGPTKIGKTAVLCGIVANMLLAGYNVLYFTLEMAAERIGERIDANLFDRTTDRVMELDLDSYMEGIRSIKSKTTGNLVIKEYPPAFCTTAHIRSVLDELKLKKKFIPHILVVDYMGEMASTFIKDRGDLYSYGKSLTRELRAVGVERNLPVLTAAQTNRSGQSDTDIELDGVGESHGISQGCDSMIALISTEELEQMKQLRMKQLLNRYGPAFPKFFNIGLDRDKMRVYNVSDASSMAHNQAEANFKSVNKPTQFGHGSTQIGHGPSNEVWTI